MGQRKAVVKGHHLEPEHLPLQERREIDLLLGLFAAPHRQAGHQHGLHEPRHAVAFMPDVFAAEHEIGLVRPLFPVDEIDVRADDGHRRLELMGYLGDESGLLVHRLLGRLREPAGQEQGDDQQDQQDGNLDEHDPSQKRVQFVRDIGHIDERNAVGPLLTDAVKVPHAIFLQHSALVHAADEMPDQLVHRGAVVPKEEAALHHLRRVRQVVDLDDKERRIRGQRFHRGVFLVAVVMDVQQIDHALVFQLRLPLHIDESADRHGEGEHEAHEHRDELQPQPAYHVHASSSGIMR